MAQLAGSATEGILGFETSYGTPNTDGYKIAFNPDLQSSSEKSINNANEITGVRSPQQGFLGFENGVFSGSFRVDNKQFPIFLKGLFNAPVSVDNGDGSYTHTFKIGSTIPSMFFELNHTDNADGLFYMNKGIGLDSLGISFAGDDELTVSISGISQTVTKATATAVTGTVTDVTDGTKFMKFSSNVTGVDKVTDLSIDFKNNISADDSRYLNGTGQIAGLPVGVAEVSGTLSAQMQDDTIFQKARNFETLSISSVLTIDAKNKVEFIMSEVNASAKSNADINTPNGLKVDGLGYKAFYKSGADASAIVIKITNESETV